MQETRKRRREVIEGEVVGLGANWIRLKGYRNRIIFPSGEFDGERQPCEREVWRCVCDVVSDENDPYDSRTFARAREFIGISEANLLDLDGIEVTYEGRPDFENVNWYYKIKDVRGEVYSATYSEYIASDAWRCRADMCLERDGHQCTARLPGCSIVATQVHHGYGAYRHLGLEPVFELYSVCRSCHDVLTGMDRRNSGRNGSYDAT